MNDKKQIEELARDIGESLGITYEGEQVPFRLKTRNYLAEELVNKGYQNCKDKVVLTMEEFDEFRKDRAEVKFLKKQITDQARKETAEKFAEKLKSMLFDLGNIVNEEDIDELLKEFNNENK